MATEGRPKYFSTGDLELAKELYETIDNLLKAVGNLPLNYIMDRPPLMSATNRGHEVIDRAVREGRYVVPSSE